MSSLYYWTSPFCWHWKVFFHHSYLFKTIFAWWTSFFFSDFSAFFPSHLSIFLSFCPPSFLLSFGWFSSRFLFFFLLLCHYPDILLPAKSWLSNWNCGFSEQLHARACTMTTRMALKVSSDVHNDLLLLIIFHSDDPSIHCMCHPGTRVSLLHS